MPYIRYQDIDGNWMKLLNSDLDGYVRGGVAPWTPGEKFGYYGQNISWYVAPDVQYIGIHNGNNQPIEATITEHPINEVRINFDMYRQAYLVTVTKGEGISSATESKWYYYGARVNLVATPYEGNNTIKWEWNNVDGTIGIWYGNPLNWWDVDRTLEFRVSASYSIDPPISDWRVNTSIELGQEYMFENVTEGKFYKNGANATVQAQTKTGYRFKYWTWRWSNDGYAYEYTAIDNPFNFVVGANVNLVAHAEAIPYNITYNLDGGSVSIENPTTYTIDTPTFTLNNPTKEGHTFQGWKDDSGTTRNTVTIEKGSTGNRTYTAIWSANTYTVTLNKATGIKNVSGGGEYRAGDLVTIDATLSDNTAQFTYGWDKWTGTYESSNKQYTFTMPASNVTLTANGTKRTNTYLQKVKPVYEDENGNFIDNGRYEINMEYEYGAIVSWNRREDSTYQAASIESYTVTGEKETIVRVYRKKYTVTLNKGTGIKDVTGYGEYRVGKNVTIDATLLDNTAKFEYGWSKWTGTYESSNKQYTFTMPTSNVTLTANGTQTLRSYTQIIKVEYEKPNGEFEPPTVVKNEKYNYGETVIWSRAADDTYQAARIESYTVTGERETIVKVYRKKYAVTLNKGTGINSVTGGGRLYRVDEDVQTDATVSTAYRWSKWTGTHNTTNKENSFKMPKHNVTNTANAVLITHDIIGNVSWRDDGNAYGLRPNKVILTLNKTPDSDGGEAQETKAPQEVVPNWSIADGKKDYKFERSTNI